MKFVMKFVMLSVLGVAAMGAFGLAPGQEPKAFRLIDIPAREHGYGNFKSRVIVSQKQFDTFVKAVQGQQGWNNRPAFLAALTAAKMDFSKEALVLIRQSEGSGSNRVSFASPHLKSGKLVCTIQREIPEIGTDDLADYCFALAATRSNVTAAEVWVTRKGSAKANKPREVLPIMAN